METVLSYFDSWDLQATDSLFCFILNLFWSQKTSASVRFRPPCEVSMWCCRLSVWCNEVWLAARTALRCLLTSCVVFQMVIGQQSSGSSSNLTELQVVNLDAAQSSKSDWQTAAAVGRRDPGTRTDWQTDWLTDGWTDRHLYLLMPSYRVPHYTSECDFKVNIYIYKHTIKGIFVADPDTVYSMFWYINIYIYIYSQKA